MASLSRRAAIVLVTAALLVTTAGAGPAEAATPRDVTASGQVALTGDWAATTPIGSYNVRILGEAFSSPAVGDVTGSAAPEIVVGSNSGNVLIYDTAGSLVRSISTDSAPTSVLGSPALADLNGDGKQDIVVGMMPMSDAAAGATVAAFTGTGTLLWARKTCRFAGKACDVFASPAIGDVDGDGLADVVIGSQDHYVYALRGATGADLPGWPFFLWDTTWSSATIADLDGNGTNEVVVASDLDISTCQVNPAVQPCTFGSLLRVLRSNGSEQSRFNIPGEITISSPAIGDVDGNGRPDIVIGSGFYFLTLGYSDVPSRRVWAFDGSLHPLAGWPAQLDGRSMASPALVDVDGNGASEIATMAEDGRVTVLNGNGSRRWTVCNRNPGQPCDRVDFSMNSSPVVADLDGDGQQEVVALSEHMLRVFDAATGTVEWSEMLWQPDRKPFANAATPAVASIGGKARLFVHGLIDAHADGIRGNGDADSLWSFSAANDLGPSAWPMFRQNAQRTGTALQTVPIEQTPNGRYVIHAYRDLLFRDPTPAEIRYQVNVISAFGRAAFAHDVAYSWQWIGHVVHDLFVQVLEREPTPNGYWTFQILAGMPARDVAVYLLSSPEYWALHGGTAGGFVDALFQLVRGRAPTPAARTSWIGAVNRRGVASVAREFYESIQSRRARATTLYQELLHRTPAAKGRDQYAARLLLRDDLAVAGDLVATNAFFAAS
jgi:hypothetical protein